MFIRRQEYERLLREAALSSRLSGEVEQLKSKTAELHAELLMTAGRAEKFEARAAQLESENSRLYLEKQKKDDRLEMLRGCFPIWDDSWKPRVAASASTEEAKPVNVRGHSARDYVAIAQETENKAMRDQEADHRKSVLEMVRKQSDMVSQVPAI